MIEQAFDAYTKAVEVKFESSTMKEGRVEWLNKEVQLRHVVDQLEKRPEFNALVRETLSAFRSDDWHSAKGVSWWRDPIRNFFCRTGYYTDTFFKGSDTSRDFFHGFEKAFQRRSVQTTYLAPMEFVRFPTRKPELKVSGFEIRKFDRNELDAVVRNDVNCIFYSHAFLDKDTLDTLQEYWFIVVKKPEKAPRLRPPRLTISKEALGFVSPEYSRFPPAIERVLERLALFDWLEKPQRKEPKKERDQQSARWPYGLPFGFNIPFVIRVDDNDLKGPESAPDCSKLMSYGPKYGDPETGEEYNAHHVIFDLNESRTAATDKPGLGSSNSPLSSRQVGAKGGSNGDVESGASRRNHPNGYRGNRLERHHGCKAARRFEKHPASALGRNRKNQPPAGVGVGACRLVGSRILDAPAGRLRSGAREAQASGGLS